MKPSKGSETGSPDDVLVELICVTADHVAAGLRVPDGSGTLTVKARRWAYCTAGLQNVEHQWKETGGVAFDSIRHADLGRYVSGT